MQKTMHKIKECPFEEHSFKRCLRKTFNLGKLVVKDKSFRKHELVNEFFGIGEISNMFFSVAVAGQNNRKLIFLTEI